MKQTAMQMLHQRLLNDIKIFPKYKEYIDGILYDISNELEQIEIDNIIKAYDEANTELHNDDGSFITGEQYYNNTFKND